jgi:hypothetical protein
MFGIVLWLGQYLDISQQLTTTSYRHLSQWSARKLVKNQDPYSTPQLLLLLAKVIFQYSFIRHAVATLANQLIKVIEAISLKVNCHNQSAISGPCTSTLAGSRVP